jgi:hypothetical protein
MRRPPARHVDRVSRHPCARFHSSGGRGVRGVERDRPQVEYDRPNRVWQRRESIARKHAYETSVDPFTGEIVAGVQHAPLLYASDPRTDLPEDLQTRITDVIRDRDELIVNGWLNANLD